MPSSSTVTIFTIFKVGSRDEDKGIAGISHYLEHIFFKGNEKYDTPKKVAEKIESLGGDYNAFTSKEYTAFYAKVGASFFDEAFEWLGSLLSSPLIKSDDVEKERGVILEEINMYRDNPTSMVDDVFEELLYKSSSLGKMIIGTPSSLKRIKSAQLKSYFNKYYSPSNTMIVVAGNLEAVKSKDVLKAVEDKVGKYFEFDSKDKRPKEKKQSYNSSEKVKIMYKKTDQTHLYLGAKAFPFADDKNYPLSLLSSILGGGMSSWAFEEIREKRGLAYYVRSSSGMFSDTGYVAINAGLNNNKLILAIEEIVRLFKKAREKLVSTKELERVKKQATGKMLLARETSDDIAFLLGKEIMIRGKMVPFSKKIEILKKISRDDLKKVACEVLQPKDLRLGLIGPWKKKDQDKFERVVNKF